MIYKEDTDYAQSWRLVELGVPERTASRDHASWPTGWEGGREIPCWTLGNLFDLCPKKLCDTWEWRVRYAVGEYVVEYTYNGKTHEDLITHSPELLDALVELVEKLVKHGYLKFNDDEEGQDRQGR